VATAAVRAPAEAIAASATAAAGARDLHTGADYSTARSPLYWSRIPVSVGSPVI